MYPDPAQLQSVLLLSTSLYELLVVALGVALRRRALAAARRLVAADHEDYDRSTYAISLALPREHEGPSSTRGQRRAREGEKKWTGGEGQRVQYSFPIEEIAVAAWQALGHRRLRSRRARGPVRPGSARRRAGREVPAVWGPPV